MRLVGAVSVDMSGTLLRDVICRQLKWLMIIDVSSPVSIIVVGFGDEAMCSKLGLYQ